MPHITDPLGYPVDPELRRLEFHLGDLAAQWRSTYGDDNRQAALVHEYHATLGILYAQGWDSVLDSESELPDALMPQEYMRRHGR